MNFLGMCVAIITLGVFYGVALLAGDAGLLPNDVDAAISDTTSIFNGDLLASLQSDMERSFAQRR